MKLIKTPQELEYGKKYYCRDKTAYANGEKKIVIMTVSNAAATDGECNDNSKRRCLLPGRFWCYDKNDRILSFDGLSRIDKLLREHGEDYIVSVFASDYEENNQAMERWDIIGPVPEINDKVIHLLFDNPEIMELTEQQIRLFTDGSIGVMTQDGETFEDEVWEHLMDEEDAEMLKNHVHYESMQRTLVSDH